MTLNLRPVAEEEVCESCAAELRDAGLDTHNADHRAGYAAGYAKGHRAGWDSGWDYGRHYGEAYAAGWSRGYAAATEDNEEKVS
jgi:hypothetical protein